MTLIDDKKQSTTRILIHCQDDAGLEGAECTLAMTTHWSRLYTNSSFLILTDLGKFNSLSLPAHVDYIHIPSDRMRSETVMLREAVLMTTLAHFDPHMLIVHYSLAAILQSSHDVASYTRQHHPTIKIVLGLWSPANEQTNLVTSDWLDTQLSYKLQSLYDQIWLYTPESLFENVNGNSQSSLLTQLVLPSANGSNGHHH